MILSAQELIEVTARERPCAQARELDHLGIPYRRRRDGSLLVLRSDVEGGFSGSIKREPRLRLVHGSTP